MKRDSERFLPFVGDAYLDIESFCKGEVEPMGKECEQPQIIALTECLGIPIDIAYLDGRYLLKDSDYYRTFVVY